MGVRVIGCGIAAVLVFTVGAFAAQDKPAESKSATPAAESEQSAAVTEVPEDVKRTLVDLQWQAGALTRAQAVLQKELDSITAEYMRLVTRVQQQAPDGFAYDQQRMVYVPKKKAK